MQLKAVTHALLAPGFVVVLMAAAGCSSSQQTSVPGALNTGTFPNLNIAPTSAATPITAEEKAAMFGSISAAQGAQAAAANSSAPVADPQLLKRIGQNHGKQALEAIEGQR